MSQRITASGSGPAPPLPMSVSSKRSLNAHLYIDGYFWRTLLGQATSPTLNYMWVAPTPVHHAGMLPSPSPTVNMFTFYFEYVREDAPGELIYRLMEICP